MCNHQIVCQELKSMCTYARHSRKVKEEYKPDQFLTERFVLDIVSGRGQSDSDD